MRIVKRKKQNTDLYILFVLNGESGLSKWPSEQQLKNNIASLKANEQTEQNKVVLKIVKL